MEGIQELIPEEAILEPTEVAIQVELEAAILLMEVIILQHLMVLMVAGATIHLPAILQKVV